MKKYYVSGKYDGVDIGMEVEEQNRYMAVYHFIDKASLKRFFVLKLRQNKKNTLNF